MKRGRSSSQAAALAVFDRQWARLAAKEAKFGSFEFIARAAGLPVKEVELNEQRNHARKGRAFGAPSQAEDAISGWRSRATNESHLNLIRRSEAPAGKMGRSVPVLPAPENRIAFVEPDGP